MVLIHHVRELGATRWRVVAQLCYESALLTVAGSVFGVLFAWGAQRALLRLIKLYPWSEPPILGARPGIIVLLFTLALAGFTVFISGFLPAWRASHVDPATDIKEGNSTITSRMGRHSGAWLVPIQVGVSFVIVMIAALMGSTVMRLIEINPGFRTDGVTFLSSDFSPRETPISDRQHAAVPPALYVAILNRIRSAGGVESASISQGHQLGGGMWTENASSTLASGETRTDSSLASLSVTPGYFQTLGIPMLTGRDFTVDDRQEARTACILSYSAAEYFFPRTNAIGQILRIGKGSSVQVIGIVGDTLYNDLREKAPRIVYQPYLGGMSVSPFAEIAVRAHDPAIAISAVKSAVRELAPDVVVDKPATIADLLRNTMGRERMIALLAGFFALLTLVLTSIGLFGVVNSAVLQRRTEIGVRMALGASPAGIVRMIMIQAAKLVLPGVLIGTVGIWSGTRLLRSLLFDVKPLDPKIFLTSLLVLLITAILACFLPAKRAAMFRPMDALRFE